MTLRLALQGARTKAPALMVARGSRAASTAASGQSPSNKPPTTGAIKDNPNSQDTNPQNTPPAAEIPSKKVGHDQWMSSLASDSEATVKADRAKDPRDFKDLQEQTKKVAEEMKDSTASLTDSLWRSVGGGR